MLLNLVKPLKYDKPIAQNKINLTFFVKQEILTNSSISREDLGIGRGRIKKKIGLLIRFGRFFVGESYFFILRLLFNFHRIISIRLIYNLPLD